MAGGLGLVHPAPMLLVLLLLRPALACEPLPGFETLTPRHSIGMPLDGMVAVGAWSGLGARLVNTEDGSVVAVDEALTPGVVWQSPDRTLATDLVVLQPLEPLAPHTTYEIQLGEGGVADFAFITADRWTDPELPPVPVPTQRSLESELRLTASWCGEAQIRSRAVYELCGEGELYVAAVQDERPTARTLLDAPVSAIAHTRTHLDVAKTLDISAGERVTVWFAAFDEAGRTRGWWGPEHLDMPRSRYTVWDRPADWDGAVCPTEVTWERTGTQHCPTWLGRPRCASVPASQAYSCAHAGLRAGLGAWWGVFLLAAARRRASSAACLPGAARCT